MKVRRSTRLPAAVALLVLWGVGGARANPDAKAEIDAVTRNVAEKLVRLRGLPFLRPVAKGVRTKPQLREYILDLLHKEMPDEKLDAVTKTLVKFGLMGPETDLKKLIVDLHVEQIAGFYDWRTANLYVMLDTPPSMQEMILAHEMTHALQDQHFDLGRLPLDEKHNDDLLLATQALVEGEAMGTMIDYVLEPYGQNVLGSPDIMQLIEQFSPIGGGEVFLRAPRFFRETLLFPYTRGMAFVRTVREKGGYDLLNGVYKRPPTSTEQILHPEKYLAEPDPPCRFSLPELSGILGPKWHRMDRNVLGEFGVRLVLRERLLATDGLMRAVEGWDGDLFGLYEREDDGRLLLAWITTWDSAPDAREFYDHLRMWADARFGDTRDAGPGAFVWKSAKTVGGVWLRGSDVVLVDGVGPATGGKVALAFFRTERCETDFDPPKLRPIKATKE